MSLQQPEFLRFIKGVFSEHNCDYDKIQDFLYNKFNSDSEKRECLPVLAHFYYFICTPEINQQNNTREELQIVGITSLIEAMMDGIEYKDVFSYFESEFTGQNKIEDFKKFKEDYLSKYGATKKIVKYFQEYVTKEDADGLLKSIEKYSKETGESKPLENLEQLAKFLYNMRSDFVHKADMQLLCPKGSFSAMVVVNKKIYTLSEEANISLLLRIFEKSFVLFWKRKYVELNSK